MSTEDKIGNPALDKALLDALSGLHGVTTDEHPANKYPVELAYAGSAWGQFPAAKAEAEQHVEAGEFLAKKFQMEGLLSSELSRETDPERRKALSDALAAVQQANDPQALSVALMSAESASAGSGGAETVEQEKARLWGEIGKLNESINDDLSKLHNAGYIDDKNYEELRKERARIDAMPEGKNREESENAYQQRVQQTAEKAKREAERRGDQPFITTATHATTTSQTVVQKVRMVEDIHHQNQGWIFSETTVAPVQSAAATNPHPINASSTHPSKGNAETASNDGATTPKDVKPTEEKKTPPASITMSFNGFGGDDVAEPAAPAAPDVRAKDASLKKG